MNIKDLAAKHGYTYTPEKRLAQTETGEYYSRTTHVLVDQAGARYAFRDTGSAGLWLTTRDQLEIPGTQAAPKPKK